MRHLNALVDGEKREIADVAREHLHATGLSSRG
jgi:glycine betaine/choline ABC-type transport system substrate-binding protein